MHSRTSNAFSVLQATAAIVGIAIVLWSLGLPSFRFADAANVTFYSDTLSDSAPTIGSDHTIVFQTPTGVTAGQSIVLTFPDGASDFNLSTIGAEEIDIASTTGNYSVQNGAASNQIWGISTSTFSITLTSGTAVLSPNATVTIRIGTNADYEAGTQSQIINPAVGSYEINVNAGPSDSGGTRVAIVNTVLVTASVDTLFTFAVSGRPGGTTVNGHTTGGPTSTTTIPFGKLEANTASTAAQLLTVTTNAKNGYSVTVEADGMLDSTNGADIDGFANGTYTASPAVWTSPSGTPGSENTYGHWGLTTDDTALIGGADFSGSKYVSASTSPVQIMSHTGPVNGSGVGVGTTTVGYRVQISGLQEAADDYDAVLTYIATPVF
jgi:hypothetical protein